MKIRLFLSFLFLTFCCCKSPYNKVETINSKANLSKNILPLSKINHSKKNRYNEDQIIDSLKKLLLIKKTAVVPHSWADIIEKINFKDFKDTVTLANIYFNSPTGGVPLKYTYPVNQNDLVFYKFKNFSRNKLNSFTIKEGTSTRFKIEDFSKKDSINNSLKISSGDSLSFIIDNNNQASVITKAISAIKSSGFLRSKLFLEVKKLSKVSLTSEIIIDTVKVKQNILETQFDTIFKIEQSTKFNLGSKLNLKEVKENLFPITINTKDSLIGWSYWIGLKNNDTISISDNRNNPLSIFSLSELNNVKTPTDEMIQLKSINTDLDIFFENYSFDRRSLNFSKNYSFFRVDNNFYKNYRKRGLIKLINNSTLYDYDIQFVVVSISLRSTKIQVKKEIFELKKFIKLNLIGS
tara:strand:- start:30 stop:1253 length:1224 start_codon:yes stop_codon:yes gene_type:complete